MDDLGGGTVNLGHAGFVRAELIGRQARTGRFAKSLGCSRNGLAGEYLRFVVSFEAVQRHAQMLLDVLRGGFDDLEGIRIVSPLDWDAAAKAPLVSFTLDDMTTRRRRGDGCVVRNRCPVRAFVSVPICRAIP